MSEQSIWKKEISFRRKPKPAEPEVAPAESPAAEEASESFWKKEISFGRKPKGERAPKTPKAKATKRDKAKSADGEQASIWKKEISFGRKAKAASVVEPAAEEDVTLAPEPVAERLPAPVEAPPAVEAPPVSDALPVVEAPPAVVEPAPQTVGFALPVEVEPEPAVPAAAEAGAAYDYLAVEPEPEPIVDVPVPAAPPAAAAPVPPPVEAAPVVHPPVPAAALRPEPAKAEARVPFWKKEISLGRKRDDGAAATNPAKAEKPPRAAKEKKPRQPLSQRVRAPRVDVGGRSGKRLVGLKIGASQLAAARVSNNGSAELLQVAREPLAGGIVVGGELREPEALADALKEFFKKHRLPRKGVRLGIANNRIGVRTFEIAGITDEKQLTNAIRFRAQEALPIPIEDAVLDYQILSEAPGEDGQPMKRVLLVVAYRDLIDRYIDACRKAGITLTGIDLEAFALLRAVQAPQEGVAGDPQAALVAVAIGHERSTFAVSDGRVCEFTRVLEWGGSALNVALARVLDATPSEVEAVKRALPLTTNDVPDGLTAERAAEAREAMRRAIQVFARELVSSLQFYQGQPGSLGIGEIVLSGGTAHLAGLAEELERLIGVRVRVGDPLARMKVSRKVGDPEQVGSLAVAIGLGIED